MKYRGKFDFSKIVAYGCVSPDSTSTVPRVQTHAGSAIRPVGRFPDPVILPMTTLPRPPFRLVASAAFLASLLAVPLASRLLRPAPRPPETLAELSEALRRFCPALHVVPANGRDPQSGIYISVRPCDRAGSRNWSANPNAPTAGRASSTANATCGRARSAPPTSPPGANTACGPGRYSSLAIRDCWRTSLPLSAPKVWGANNLLGLAGLLGFGWRRRKA